MKFILLLLLMALQQLSYAQDAAQPFLPPGFAKDSILTEIQLSKTIDESRMGIWETGTYKICIPLQALEEYFRKEHTSLIDAMEHQYRNDTAAAARCKLYAERYLLVVHQLKAAKNGYDLKQLVIYVGPNNEIYNRGNSSTVNMFIRQWVENGNAVVFHKGKRIYTLHKLVQWDAAMSAIKIYHTERDDCAYNYIGHINW